MSNGLFVGWHISRTAVKARIHMSQERDHRQKNRIRQAGPVVKFHTTYINILNYLCLYPLQLRDSPTTQEEKQGVTPWAFSRS